MKSTLFRQAKEIRKGMTKSQFDALFIDFVKPLRPLKAITDCALPHGATRAYSNNRYIVIVYDDVQTTKGLATQVLIQNIFGTRIKDHWSEIQRIKNELFGDEAVGIEFYPKESELVDEHNIYWLWVMPSNLLPMPLNSKPKISIDWEGREVEKLKEVPE